LRAPIFLLALLIALPAANTFDPGVQSRARKLQRQAIDDDFLVSVNAQRAEQHLTEALTICKDKCSPKLRAELYRDLGTVVAAMFAATRFADAVAAFTEALTLDPSTRPVITIVPPIQTAFAAAQRAYASRIVDAGGQ